MMDHTLLIEDDHRYLMDKYGIFPSAVRYFLTRDLVFLEKEHLRQCRYSPDDWYKKQIKLK